MVMRKWWMVTGIVVVLISLLSLTAAPALAEKGSDSDLAGQGLKNWGAHTTFHVHGGGILPFQGTTPAGLSPTQIQAAYNLPSTGNPGTGTIAIIDAYDDPTIQNDLNAFSIQYGLATPNFEEHKMASNLSTDSGWALEISLDVEWAHAIAPGAKVLLVEAASSSFSDLLAAVDYARSRSDVVAISMSWGGSEFSLESTYDSHFTSAYGATFFASAGDNGAGVMWPAVSPNVTGVGGTNLSFSGSTVSETAWRGSGGGISSYETEPSYQSVYFSNGGQGTSLDGKRGVPDVSYDGGPNSAVAVYDTTAYGGTSGWFQVYGTSVGAPQWAAIRSLGLSALNNNFYADAISNYSKFFRDITTGDSRATAAYDLVTGLGSPMTTNFAPAPDFSLSAAPAIQSVTSGGSTTYTVTVNPMGGFNGSVTLSIGSIPIGPTGTFSINSTSNTSVLTVSTSASIANGTYTLTITGVSGSLTHTATVTLVVGNPSFAITISPSSQTVRRGSAASYIITIKPSGGFNSAVSLSVTGLPGGTSASFSPNPATSSSTLRISTSRRTNTGTYALTIKGVSGSMAQTVMTTLIVTN